MIRKQRLLKLPQEIDKLLENYKEVSGMNVNNMIYNAIVQWLIMRELLDISDIKNLNDKYKQKIEIEKEDKEVVGKVDLSFLESIGGE